MDEYGFDKAGNYVGRGWGSSIYPDAVTDAPYANNEIDWDWGDWDGINWYTWEEERDGTLRFDWNRHLLFDV